MSDPLDDASRALIERIVTELRRPPQTAGTHLVGGITKIGSKLEALLRLILVEMAVDLRSRPEEFLPDIGGKKVSLARATAGQIGRALREGRSQRGWSPGKRTRVLIHDLDGMQSRVSKAIELRNAAAHDGAVPSGSAKAMNELRGLVERYRREAGWELVDELGPQS